MPKNKKDVCPTCKCNETVTHTFRHDQGFLEETWTECKQCKRLKHHWSYGCLYVDNWKDGTQPPLRYRIMQAVKKIIKRKRKESNNGKHNQELPF